MRRRILVIMVAVLALAIAAPVQALELKGGLDVEGQWMRGQDRGYYARLKIISVEGTQAKLAYGTGRSGYDGITGFHEYDGKVSELSSGIKEVKFTGWKTLSDFVFTFDPRTPDVRGTWTNTFYEIWQIEMK